MPLPSLRRTAVIIWGALVLGAVASVALGYVLLSLGSTTAAPLLLVLGYCILFPIGLAR